MRKPGALETVLHAFTSRRMAVVLLQGFVCGIPLALTFATLQAWMATEKVDLTLIGIFSLVGLPYTVKFLWAPLMDRYVPPFLGRRRGWILVCQVALMISISALAFSQPAQAPGVVAVLALLVAFCSSSQDIVVDAYRTEILSQEEFGVGSSLYVMGYRIAMLVSGGGALILSDHMSFRAVYLIMASTMLLGVFTTLIAPEPEVRAAPPKSIHEAFILPLVEYFKRRGAIETLLFLIVYKLDSNLTVAMTTPFMLSIGFSKTDIGAVVKGGGTIATVLGAIVGGGMMVKLGLRRSLWIFGISQAIAGLTYMILAHLGHNYPFMVAAITTENFFSGMGIAAQSALMMSLCDKRFTATQYSLLASFMGLSRYVAGAPSGWLAKTFGWEHYFLICALAGIPGLLMLLRLKAWKMPNAAKASS